VVPSEPSGTILMWSGLESAINWRWKLCNGLAGTPDLRDKFIIAAGGGYAKGNTGGSLTHSHSITYPTHHHHFVAVAGIKAGLGYDGPTSNTIVTGNLLTTNSVNPYYSLCYIMKK